MQLYPGWSARDNYVCSFYLSEILPLHVCAWKLLLLFLIFRVKGRGSRASRYQEALPGRFFFNIWQSSHIHKYRTWWYLKDFGISVSEYMPKIQIKCNTQKYKNKIEQCFISLLNNKCIYFISVCSDMEFYGNILTCLHWDFFNVQILILPVKLSVLYI